ncbi:hypothetical protein HELRODRAFT_193625 [Helobdella robusta]|uniref:EGF-like domain-containing protein n=1 Tax=Helobdella robusta TaxID=6412 RepID=T1FV72_HELRO|nr:hypothetical protein HELRODRAFT_193625 [Helobdella robusta]ESN95306.1 hypothetical protein HELRODRAFT_193625 [Helobdella robusta]
MDFHNWRLILTVVLVKQRATDCDLLSQPTFQTLAQAQVELTVTPATVFSQHASSSNTSSSSSPSLTTISTITSNTTDVFLKFIVAVIKCEATTYSSFSSSTASTVATTTTANIINTLTTVFVPLNPGVNVVPPTTTTPSTPPAAYSTTTAATISNLTVPCFAGNNNETIRNNVQKQMIDSLVLDANDLAVLSITNYNTWNAKLSLMLRSPAAYKNVTQLLNSPSNYIFISNNKVYFTNNYTAYNYSRNCTSTCLYLCAVDDQGDPTCLCSYTNTGTANVYGCSSQTRAVANDSYLDRRYLGLLAIPVFVILVIIIGVIVFCCMKKKNDPGFVGGNSSAKSKYLKKYDTVEVASDQGHINTVTTNAYVDEDGYTRAINLNNNTNNDLNNNTNDGGDIGTVYKNNDEFRRYLTLKSDQGSVMVNPTFDDN